MSLDLQAILRAVGGEVLQIHISDRSPVDAVTEIDAYVVVGNPDYVTLITGSSDTLRTRLEAATNDNDPLINAVFVSDHDSPELRA